MYEPPIGNYVIVYEAAGERHKLCRVMFGADGSYYVTCPYHASAKERALFLMFTVNYTLDVGTSDRIHNADVHRFVECLKLSHHPDGFLQFSGPGIVSGRGESGEPRGFGIMSWPLDRPPPGPAFAVTIRGLDHFETEAAGRPEDVTYTERDVAALPEPKTYMIEGYYYPPKFRRFVRPLPHGGLTIAKLHPSGTVIPLRVLLPRNQAHGFIGVEVYTIPRELPDPDHGFIISTSSGNARRSHHGALLADVMACVVPIGDFDAGRDLMYQPPASVLGATDG
jgi:hypothetical protein